MSVADVVGWIAQFSRGARGEGGVSGYALTSDESFVWRVGKGGEVIVERAGEVWTVTYTDIGRLLGPRRTRYEGRHREDTYAAWDVMTRVVHATKDEDEGLQAGRQAAQWIIAWRAANRIRVGE